MATPMSWIVLLQLSLALVHGYNGMGFDGWYQPVPHRPVDIITDVINDLGVRILQQYTSHGNVAFSPTGVGFVLAALYEGSAARGRQQISDAMGLPRDPDVTRIGYRDIHRRLRTYLNADGFLGGLTLNQENTRLRPEYEDVLRFYGFDLSIPEEANATTSAPETTVAATDQPVTEPGTPDSGVTTQQPMQETQTPGTTATPTQQPMQETQTPGTTATPTQQPMQETQTPGTTTTTQQPMQETQTPGTTATPTQQPMQETQTPGTTTTTQRPMQETQTPETTATTQQPKQDSEAMSTTPTVELLEMTLSTADTQDRLAQTTPAPTTLIETTSSEDTSTLLESTTASDESISNSVEPTTISPVQATETTATTTSPSAATNPTGSQTSEPSESTTTSMTEATTMESLTTGSTISSSTQVTENGATNGPPADGDTVSTESSNRNTDLPVTATATGSNVSDSMNRIRKRSARSPRGYFSSYPDEGIWMQDLGIWKPYSSSLSEASVRDSTEISFLVNGCDVSSVTATRYFAVLPFAYFPSLHAVALEFPLDDPRYNILLLMSTDRRDTYRLARDLGGKSLRLLRKQLQATWVRATIPSFMLRGFVTLTSFLQRLGILDVFEPRTADLSPMTPDLGVYARDVQQSIGLNIRNYMKPDRTHSRNGLFERAGPVPFTVVQPFLYFIVDAETSVVLIAGRVNDPLNSRIL